MELTPEEIRVLGCLIEKEATTPDNYPLSTNALVNACNQTTSRDPIVNYSERDVDQAMLSLREHGLARTVRGAGQRVHKHKHVLDEAWGLDAAELAVLSVLMLRGPQTAAECRARTERYGVGLDVDATEHVLHTLATRAEPLVRQLERRPGERGARWVQLLGGDAMGVEQASAEPPVAAPERANARRDELDELRARVDELERRVALLYERLGEDIDS